MSSFAKLIQAWVDLIKNKKVSSLDDLGKSGDFKIQGGVSPTNPMTIQEKKRAFIQFVEDRRGYKIEKYELDVINRMRAVDIAFWQNLVAFKDTSKLPVIYFTGLRFLQLIHNVSHEINIKKKSSEVIVDLTNTQENKIRRDGFSDFQELYMARMGRLISDNEIISISEKAQITQFDFNKDLYDFEETLRKLKRDRDSIDNGTGAKIQKFELKNIVVGWMRSFNLNLDNCGPEDNIDTEPLFLDLSKKGTPREKFKDLLKRGTLSNVQFPCDPDGKTPQDHKPSIEDKTNDPINPTETLEDKQQKFTDMLSDFKLFLQVRHTNLCSIIQQVKSNLTNMNNRQDLGRKNLRNKLFNDVINFKNFLDSISDLINNSKCQNQISTINSASQNFNVNDGITEINKQLRNFNKNYDDTVIKSIDKLNKLNELLKGNRAVLAGNTLIFNNLDEYVNKLNSKNPTNIFYPREEPTTRPEIKNDKLSIIEKGLEPIPIIETNILIDPNDDNDVNALIFLYNKMLNIAYDLNNAVHSTIFYNGQIIGKLTLGIVENLRDFSSKAKDQAETVLTGLFGILKSVFIVGVLSESPFDPSIFADPDFLFKIHSLGEGAVEAVLNIFALYKGMADFTLWLGYYCFNNLISSIKTSPETLSDIHRSSYDLYNNMFGRYLPSSNFISTMASSASQGVIEGITDAKALILLHELQQAFGLGTRGVILSATALTVTLLIINRRTETEVLELLNKLDKKLDQPGLTEQTYVEIFADIIIFTHYLNDFLRGFLYTKSQHDKFKNKLQTVFNKAVLKAGITSEDQFLNLMSKAQSEIPYTVKFGIGLQDYIKNLTGVGVTVYTQIRDFSYSFIRKSLITGAQLILLLGAGALLVGIAQSGNFDSFSSQALISLAVGVGVVVFVANIPEISVETETETETVNVKELP